jgi:hypothetical protein
MKIVLLAVTAAVAMTVSCSEGLPYGYDIPDECNNKCELVSDMNSFRDAAANSAARFSNCICLEGGVVEGEIIVSKSLNIVGKNDGTSRLRNISFYGAENVMISNVTFKNIAAKDSAMFISGSSVKLRHVTFSNISAGSLFGGRAIVVSGKSSEVHFENVIIDKTDGTGLLIDGIHKVSVTGSVFSNCGFAGIWVQNQENEEGDLKIDSSSFNNNGAVSLQILGRSKLDVSNSLISGVSKREISMELVGDGIVVKNNMMNKPGAVTVKGVEINGFPRAGIIFDGGNGSVLSGLHLENLKLSSDEGQYGVIIQNGIEPDKLRKGIEYNPFTQKDIELTQPLFILETIQDI